MKSAFLQHDRDDLVKMSRSLSPEERLVAFFHHSRLLAKFSVTRKGRKAQRKSSEENP